MGGSLTFLVALLSDIRVATVVTLFKRRSGVVRNPPHLSNAVSSRISVKLIFASRKE
jgi:hypothetical protein